MADFKPVRAAAAASLDNLDLVDGQFIITLDTKKMYVDATVDNELSRIALGGEIDLSDYVTETEMQEAIAAIQPSGLDFSALTTALTSGTLTGLTITADTENENFDITVTNQGINFSNLSDMFTNGTLSGLTITPNAATETFNITITGLPVIAIDENDEWTIDGTSTGKSAKGVDGFSPTVTLTETGSSLTIAVTDASGTSTATINNDIIKGRVSSVEDLSNISNPQDGWIYLVGVASSEVFQKYIYINRENISRWELLGTGSSGGETDIEIVNVPTAAEINTTIANIWG